MGLVVPIVVTLAATALELLWLGDLPDPVATHWRGAGAPDGFGAPITYPFITLVFGLGLPVAMGFAGWRGIRRGHGGPFTRAIAASSAAFAVFIAVVTVWSVGSQRGLADAASAPNPWPALVWGVAVAVVVGVVGWFVQPFQAPVPASDRPGTTIEIEPGERAVWLGAASASPWLVAVVGGSAAVLVAVGIVVTLASGAGGWTFLVVGLVMAAVLAATTVFRVRVDRDGLVVRSVLGWPRFSVPIDDIARARLGDVDGFAEFGGWGLRKAPGAFGVVLRNGDAISVERHDGRRFVVTVDDDAATAVGLLQALADRARAGRC